MVLDTMYLDCLAVVDMHGYSARCFATQPAALTARTTTKPTTSITSALSATS